MHVVIAIVIELYTHILGYLCSLLLPDAVWVRIEEIDILCVETHCL